MAGASVPFKASSVPVRAGLASGSGMSITTCGAGAFGSGKEGGASNDGGFELRSGRETSETVSPARIFVTALEAEGVIGTEVVAASRSC